MLSPTADPLARSLQRIKGRIHACFRLRGNASLAVLLDKECLDASYQGIKVRCRRGGALGSIRIVFHSLPGSPEEVDPALAPARRMQQIVKLPPRRRSLARADDADYAYDQGHRQEDQVAKTVDQQLALEHEHVPYERPA